VHRGGQGVVYEALQRSTRRRVAVKVMREGPFAGPADRARFEREVQILAQLSHPHIVTIHDSGRVAACDYLVMDFIDGRPLDQFVGDHSVHLDIRAVLELFIKVCDGINAAHLRGVIHRDLKPGNVLVDALGEPHILDFGLAKQSNPTDTATPTMTATGQFVGSLPWSSPEQTRGDDVDVRTDVYSLGVMLYHGLTGRLPYPPTRRAAEILDAIREQQPPRPSAARAKLAGDLDTIVLKCLSKERERRYQSAGDLGRDIARHLRGEPIDARRDSTLYVLGRTLRRHRLATVTVVGFALLILMFAAAIAVQSERIARERDRAHHQQRRAERVQNFLQSMFAGVAPEGVPAAEVSVRTVLDDGAKRVDAEFNDWPEEAASIHETIGQTYDKLGFFTEAEHHLRRALDLRGDMLGPVDPLTVRTLGRLALIVFNRQETSQAESLLREAIELGTRALGSDDAELLGWRNELASLLVEQHRSAIWPPFTAKRWSLGDPQGAVRGELHLSSQEIGERRIAIRNEVQFDSLDPWAAQDVALEGFRLDEGSRLPSLQAVRAQPHILGGPVRMIREAIGLVLEERLLEHVSRQGRQFGVSIRALYDKLAHTETGIAAALVAHTAGKLAPVIQRLGGGLPPLLSGYRVRILDGNHLAGTEHRLKELRTLAAGALPGHTLAVLDAETMLVTDVLCCEDGHAQERAVLPGVIPLVAADDLWVADRNFCTTEFWFALATRGASGVIRHHANLAWQAIGKRRYVGRTDTGRVYEQRGFICGDAGDTLDLRRITIVLDEPTRDGDTELHILTNLPARVRA
jgi:tetratricopeptide (TPR) repeat protein